MAWQVIKQYNEHEYISQEIIWKKSKLKSNSNTFYYKKRGITLIEQLVDYRNKPFYTFSNFKTLYQIGAGDFLLHTSILHSKPKEWKCKLRMENIVTDRK